MKKAYNSDSTPTNNKFEEKNIQSEDLKEAIEKSKYKENRIDQQVENDIAYLYSYSKIKNPTND